MRPAIILSSLITLLLAAVGQVVLSPAQATSTANLTFDWSFSGDQQGAMLIPRLREILFVFPLDRSIV